MEGVETPPESDSVGQRHRLGPASQGAAGSIMPGEARPPQCGFCFQQENRKGGHGATVLTAVSVLPRPHPLCGPEHRARRSGQQSSGEGHLPGERSSEVGLTAG